MVTESQESADWRTGGPKRATPHRVYSAPIALSPLFRLQVEPEDSLMKRRTRALPASMLDPMNAVAPKTCMSADDLELAPPSSDQSLLRKFQAGDADAATQLYLRYAKRLQARAQAQVASD